MMGASDGLETRRMSDLSAGFHGSPTSLLSIARCARISMREAIAGCSIRAPRRWLEGFSQEREYLPLSFVRSPPVSRVH